MLVVSFLGLEKASTCFRFPARLDKSKPANELLGSANKRVMNMLFLGAGEVGKATMFKQLVNRFALLLF